MTMKRSLAILGFFAALSLAVFGGRGPVLNGAGATFPYPVYAKWAHAYGKTTGVRINYQSIGSGGGIRQINNRTVDFGASDAPVKGSVLKAKGQIQFPMVMGGVVPVVNAAGIGNGRLRLSGDLLADIFLGTVTRWNDKRIAALNPGTNLPDQGITVIHRADGSGTTWIFTNYLSKVSPAWKSKVGNGKAVNWPAGYGGKGNEGVASYVKQVEGAIGYVEYAYATQNKMAAVKLKNRSGRFVAPSMESFQAAAANADWAASDHYYVVLTDQPGRDSWPIAGATFIILYRNQPSPAQAKTLLRYFDWCYRNGGDMAKKLDYVPMPSSVVSMVEKTWAKEIRAKGKALWSVEVAR